jgi:hypothetical protein
MTSTLINTTDTASGTVCCGLEVKEVIEKKGI